MKILCIGDIHAKTWIIPRVRMLMGQKHVEKVVFMGDYMDDWNATPADNELVAQQLLDLERDFPDKMVFLWGNHDLSNIRKGEFICSGFDARNIVAANLLSKLPLQFAFGNSGVLFTHAGVTDAWRKSVGLQEPNLHSAQYYADDLNKVDARSYNRTGSVRGGWDDPSPVWADLTELVHDPIKNITQIVGHTPVNQITHYEVDKAYDTHILACDTFSTCPNGTKIGDETVMILDTFLPHNYQAYNLKELKEVERYKSIW